MDTHVAGHLPPHGRRVERLLRRAVLDHAMAWTRRRPVPLLHLGRPGEVEATFAPQGGELDHALRTDVVAALLHRVGEQLGDGPVLSWLSRPGDLAVEDEDAAWLAAVGQASAEAEVRLLFVVVTRRGWLEPRTGTTRTWRRIRPRSGPYKQ